MAHSRTPPGATGGDGGSRAPADAGRRPVPRLKIALGAAILLGLTGLYWGLSETGVLSALMDENGLRRLIGRLGVWGPLALILMMTGAIVLSPIPSGPIAMVAGAAFGPVWGTVYVVIGAEAGALIAFAIARFFGYEAVRHWAWGRRLLDRARSQNVLMAVVFASRLVPFISFDAVSYAAGLTPLTFWRFAVATLAGVVPISFLLVHLGEELITADAGRVMLIVLLAGGITLIPVAGRLLWTWYRRRRDAARQGFGRCK